VGHEIWQRVWDLAENLMKERPKEAERCSLEFSTSTVEEERENKGPVSDIRCFRDIVKGVS